MPETVEMLGDSSIVLEPRRNDPLYELERLTRQQNRFSRDFSDKKQTYVDWTAAVAEFVAMSLFGACNHAAISTHSEVSSYPCAVFIGCGTAAHNTDITGHIYNR